MERLGTHQELSMDRITTQYWLSWRRIRTKLSFCKSGALCVKPPPNQATDLWSGAAAPLEVAHKWGKLLASSSQLSQNLVYNSLEVQTVPIGERKFSSSTRILNFQANSKCSTGFWPNCLSRQDRMLKFSIARSSVKMTKKCTETQLKKGRW